MGVQLVCAVHATNSRSLHEAEWMRRSVLQSAPHQPLTRTVQGRARENEAPMACSVTVTLRAAWAMDKHSDSKQLGRHINWRNWSQLVIVCHTLTTTLN